MKSFLVSIFVVMTGISSWAQGTFEGPWYSEDNGKLIEFSEMNGRLTAHTRAYYPNGAPSDYFYEFQTPRDQEIQPGEVYEGRMRSIDGYYGCVFDEPAQIKMTLEGKLKMHYPLLTFHLRTRSVREERGYVYRREVDWSRWGYIERLYRFPVNRWRVVSSECIIDQRNWKTSTFTR